VNVSIEPVTWRILEKVIAKERHDALLPTMGGQTALNCALDLAREGVLEKYGVQMIGATKEAIDKAKAQGATDIEIHDTVLIAALFCLYNRYVDGLATLTPTDPEFYKGLGERLKNHGYNRLPQGYDHLKKHQPVKQ